jgi:hypothetical protein
MSCVSSLTEKLKSECRSVVKLAYEQSLAAFDTRNEAVLRQLELLSNHMSNDFDRYSQDTQHLRSLNRSSLGSGSHQKIKPKQHLTSTTISKDQHTVDREEIGSSHSPLVHLSSKKSRNTPITRHVWSFACMFGTIWVEIEWYRSNPLKHQVFSILAHFRPTNTLRFLPGISMCYSTAPTELGLYQIAPTISTFPVISTDHPIWRAIKESNVSSVQDLFASGIVNPKCQSENGITLLHVSAFSLFDVYMTLLVVLPRSTSRRPSASVSNYSMCMSGLTSSHLSMLLCMRNPIFVAS